MYWRTAAVLSSTFLFLTVIVSVFWRQDTQYSLPAVRPVDLQQPAFGDRITFAKASWASSGEKPLFLHFFNPDCPCSRFNIDHVRGLIRRYGREVKFVAVLQGDMGEERLRAAFDKLDWGMEAVIDDGGELSKAAGVYATPQAVLIDNGGRLYYRGNYNESRYCANPETEYARLALASMLAGKPRLEETAAASVAYGCPLPKRAGSAVKIL